MKRKRLNRDGWGFQYYPYYQMRIDDERFHGLACLIRLTDGERNDWHMPKAGNIQVTGGGMTWLELVPDGKKHVITVMYLPDGDDCSERERYPEPTDKLYRPSVWYADVIEGTERDEDGVAVFIDKYLDVIFTPEGDVKVDDRDELDRAYETGDVTKAQYDAALEECGRILGEYCRDIRETDRLCAGIRRIVEERIAGGEKRQLCRETAEMEKHAPERGGEEAAKRQTARA